MQRERGRIGTVTLLMSVSCPGHLLLSHVNSWNDDDIDPCWCSQLPLHCLGSAVGKSTEQPCKSTVLLKVIGAGQRVGIAVTSVLQHAIWRRDSLQVFPLYQHFSKNKTWVWPSVLVCISFLCINSAKKVIFMQEPLTRQLAMWTPVFSGYSTES